MLGRGVDGVEALGLFGRHAAAPQQVCHAEDAVHRGADLVAHVGKKCTLGHVGGLGGVTGLDQRLGALEHDVFESVVTQGESLRLSAVDVGHDAQHILRMPHAAVATIGDNQEAIGRNLLPCLGDKRRYGVQWHLLFDDEGFGVHEDAATAVKVDFPVERLGQAAHEVCMIDQADRPAGGAVDNGQADQVRVHREGFKHGPRAGQGPNRRALAQHTACHRNCHRNFAGYRRTGGSRHAVFRPATTLRRRPASSLRPSMAVAVSWAWARFSSAITVTSCMFWAIRVLDSR